MQDRVDPELARILMSERPFTYFPVVARALGSATACVLVSALMQASAGSEDFFEKRLQELQDETGLSRHEISSGFKLAEAAGWIEKERRGLPATTHYRINWGKIASDLVQVCQNSAIKFAEFQRTGTPEGTHYDTMESNGVGMGATANKFAEFQRTEPIAEGTLQSVAQGDDPTPRDRAAKSRVLNACIEFEDSVRNRRMRGGVSSPATLVDEIATAIGEVCRVDRDLNLPRLRKEARLLLKSSIPVSVETIRDRYGTGGWWYRSHWAGKKGSPPMIHQVRETWGMWLQKAEEEGAVPVGFDGMRRADFSDAEWRRLHPINRRAIMAAELGLPFEEVEDDPNFRCQSEDNGGADED